MLPSRAAVAQVQAEHRPGAARRILDGARALVSRGGAAAVSIGDVGTVAGVSKALVHYHFRDKDSLLLALAEEAGARCLASARSAVPQSAGALALDMYRDWLARELRDGNIGILISLAECDSERVRAASRRIAAERRHATAGQVASVFAQLELAPRIPEQVIAETMVALIDGLAVARALDPDHDSGPAFDALWLALLTLVE